MEILKHHEHEEASCHRHKLLHCIIHATLQVATLAVAAVTLAEVEKLHQKVKMLHRK
ncbi:hypothetical protein [uncultured Duncaniella sp.]|uniref:hypothetical protein n=1 Tax=uncultured Duncaniella sp. TaxID=2768039 RepID=UPI0023C1E71E|nr:hypothetical protein [uncultured Duncaniella sp.]MDE5665210.1 hypothetical protein [Duncaniella sp.]MDE5673482.1 hypothetical protein [Duncaniella sp.]MDE5953635.1 hypothetical protein [Duncaniella sp.]MDE5960610.1 hypothetical protein [Duncaniella sp.]